MSTKFNYAFTFSIMVLLVFSYITFLGLVYWQGGNFVVPILLTLGLIALVLLCVFVMCISKATRWKNIGTIGQVFFGFIIFATLLCASLPFTNFLRVVQDSEDLYQKVNTTCDAAINLDKAYKEYVDSRIENFKSNLIVISKGKDINPTKYQECLGGASGATDMDKIEGLAKSLYNKLLPESTSNIVKERHEWLESARSTTVWNPLTPKNINKIDEEVNGYLDNYIKLSSVSYMGEESSPFTYDAFSNQIRGLMQTYGEFQSPTLLALIIALLCFVIMLLPYILTEPDIAGKEDKKSNKHHFHKHIR